MSTTNPCINPQPGSQLASACACQDAANALAQQLTDYNTAYEAYGIAHAQWVNTDYPAWQLSVTNETTSLTNEIKTTACGESCPTGWDELNYTLCSIGYHIRTCKRQSTTVTNDLNTWLIYHAAPAEPVQPAAPNGSNILCCSQIFQGITAENINFTNIVQECNQNIQNQIVAGAVGDTAANAINSMTTPPPTVPVTTPAPRSSTNIEIIIIIIMIILLFLLGIPLFIWLFKKKK
jgi:hypothetical protein